jgi:beta-galactosidase
MKTTCPRCSLLISLLLALSSLNLFAAADSGPRERLLLDFGWKFHLGNEWGAAQNLAKAASGSGPASPSFSDASWRDVNLPHDWAIELPFDPKAGGSHGFKALGHVFPQNSVAWYRRTFELPKEDAGSRLWLEFDGAFRDCTVFVNGWCVGHHESGYSSFRYDITDVANCGGRNVIAVKVDASQVEGWFYEGAGIYRHVWLVKTAPLAIAPDGIFVWCKFENVTNNHQPLDVFITARVQNTTADCTEAQAKYEIISPDRKSVVQLNSFSGISVPSISDREFRGSVSFVHDDETDLYNRLSLRSSIITIKHTPELWSPESPKLYKLITTVEAGGKIVDRTETEFGIRSVAFDAEKGFLLNGKPYTLKGTCNHQDHAGAGAALPDRLQYFRVAKLKEMGCNAYRTSHNPPTPELLEACDRLGMLVMDENRLLGSDEENLRRWEGQIRRDRNHPSVAIWSLANEEGVQTTPAGGRVAETMQRLVKQLDPTRPVTYAANVGNIFGGINSVIEVRGWNYFPGKPMDDYHKAHPAQPNVGTEQGSTVSTRSIYANDRKRGYVSAYDDNVPRWGSTAEKWWSVFAERPWLSGGFVWTGFDYRGEPTPYGWPCINSHFGILDTCGFPKDNFWYYKSWWTERPVLHLLPHWNWPGREGEEFGVRALSNCEEVELFLNGTSLGRQAMKKNSHLRWNVKYAPGTLSAKGYKDGQAVAETKVETTGEPAAVQLTPDRTTINADGEDVSVITVAVTDAQSRVVPVASNLVHFALEGPGRILGVGNGDPSCHEPDVYLPAWQGNSRGVNEGWRWRKTSNPWNPAPPEVGAQFDDSAWATADVQSTNQLGNNEHGFFRGHFNVSGEDLALEVVELRFGSINGTGKVYVNGQKAGEFQEGGMVAVFDVKRLLHPGDNTVAVVVENYSSSGGLTKGVILRMQDKPVLPEWKRSVFNGLAQIIVQSAKKTGEIKLTARSDGLRETTLVIRAQSTPLRPAVP